MGLINMECEMACAMDDSAGQIASPCSSSGGDIFGDPQVSPRVGHQYQAEIPPFIAENERLQLTKGQEGAHVAAEVSHPFLLGLPIPITWINDEVENINGTVEFENSEESHITSSNECATLRVEPLDSILDDKMDVDSVRSQESKTKLNQAEKCRCPLPGSLGETLRDIEHDSFVLGLYIFGKNLMLVKRFVGSKQMGDILSFYYGKFYRSVEHRRWSECRKMRSRRRIHGEKLFTGWRQQELLSRLTSRVSEETKTLLLEVSRKFGDGKVSFEGYVFALKDIVGLRLLIEAVGIGRGKKDLTGMTMEPVKSSPIFPVRPEIPTGKACSALTSRDIIKFLTGGCRLSKARSNDLFWEAVWPRLLARGWHSEQPKDHGVTSLKHSLVFLIPGVKKFSRRRLVKGNHYFDSVSDVLNKVASDPELLELESETEKNGERKEDHEWDDATMEPNLDGLSKQQRHCYLQPRKPSSSQNVMKFTIIDTSLVNEKGRAKVRELRSLPFEIANLSTSSSLSSESDEDTSEESEGEADETKASKRVEDMIDRATCADSSDCVTGMLNNGADPSIVAMETRDSQSTSPVNDKQGSKTMKQLVHRKVKPGQRKYLSPVRKCQNFTASIRGESSRSRLNEGDSHCRSNSPHPCEDMALGLSQNLSSASSLAKDSPDESNEGVTNENCLHRQPSPEKHQTRALIDLNLPQVSPHSVPDEPFITNLIQNNDSSLDKSASLPERVQEPEPMKPEHEASMNSRRQSTRNRPLTTKALEALEWGFFNTKRKRKDSEAAPEHNLRPSRRLRGKTSSLGTISDNGASNDMSESKPEEEITNEVLGICDSNMDVNSHIV